VHDVFYVVFLWLTHHSITKCIFFILQLNRSNQFKDYVNYHRTTVQDEEKDNCSFSDMMNLSFFFQF